MADNDPARAPDHAVPDGGGPAAVAESAPQTTLPDGTGERPVEAALAGTAEVPLAAAALEAALPQPEQFVADAVEAVSLPDEPASVRRVESSSAPNERFVTDPVEAAAAPEEQALLGATDVSSVPSARFGSDAFPTGAPPEQVDVAPGQAAAGPDERFVTDAIETPAALDEQVAAGSGESTAVADEPAAEQFVAVDTGSAPGAQVDALSVDVTSPVAAPASTAQAEIVPQETEAADASAAPAPADEEGAEEAIDAAVAPAADETPETTEATPAVPEGLPGDLQSAAASEDVGALARGQGAPAAGAAPLPADGKPAGEAPAPAATGELFDRGVPEAEVVTDSELILDLEGYEGPLDALLQLARDQKVDLRRISMLALVDQYLAFIARARRLRLELAADYLVMAAWLAYLKSRLLLPDPPQDNEPSGAEMADALQLQLRRLEAMQEAGARLMARPLLGVDIWGRGQPEGTPVMRRVLWDIKLYDLLKIYGEIHKPADANRYEIAPMKFFSVEEAVERLSRMLGLAIDWKSLMAFLPPGLTEAPRMRSAMAATFVATLQLAKDGLVQLRQTETYGPIFLRRRAQPGPVETPS